MCLSDTLEEIENEAFCGCVDLEHIIIPPSVKKIGAGAFRDCVNLKEIYFSEGLEEIGANAFAGCEKIWDLSLPMSLRRIGTGAFRDCRSLRFLDVESPVLHEIEPYAFANTGLQFVTLRLETTCILENQVFADCLKLERIIFPYGPTVLNCDLAECVPQVEICAPKGSYTEHFAQYYGLKFQEWEED